MIDAFDLWRWMWTPATDVSPPRASLAAAPEKPDLAAFSVLGRMRIELPTMWLLELREPAKIGGIPVLIVAPYSLHDSLIADLAPGHSLAAALLDAGVGSVAATFWKSATPDMRDWGVDAYLSDLNVAVDDLGGRAALVGLCQGGWLAAIYAARFPAKVEKLVLAGAPVDLTAAESAITRTLAGTEPETIERMVAVNGGRVLGSAALGVWAPGLADEYEPEVALQCEGDSGLLAKFAAWNARTVNLPGQYFLQTTEWLFRENRLARGEFPALGRIVHLSDIRCPVFVLAAEDDRIVEAPQATALARFCADVTVKVMPGRHLSLFMGRETLRRVWPEIGAWLAADAPVRRRKPPKASGSRGERRRGPA